MSRRSEIMISKSLYQIGLATLIVSILWVMLAVYQALQKPPIGGVSPEMLEPLSTKIDEEALDKLMTRRQMGEIDWQRLSEQEIVASGSAVAEP